MFNIDSSDEEIAKKKKWTLLGLFILLGLVGVFGPFLVAKDSEPSQVALAEEAATETTVPQPTATSTASPTAIPTVTPTSTPQPTATPTSLPATPTAVPPTVTPTSTTNANEFTPDVQALEEGDAGEAGQSITEGVVEEATAEMSSEATGEGTLGEQQSSETTAEEPNEASAETTETVLDEQGTETTTETNQEEPSAESETSSSVETGSEQASEATPEVISPETLPTTGLGGLGWGMTWLALGVILVLIGFGVTSASNNY